MKVSDLVRYVGPSKVYKGCVGVVIEVRASDALLHTAMVHWPGMHGVARDRKGTGNTNPSDGLHPMGFEELEVVA